MLLINIEKKVAPNFSRHFVLKISIPNSRARNESTSDCLITATVLNVFVLAKVPTHFNSVDFDDVKAGRGTTRCYLVTSIIWCAVVSARHVPAYYSSLPPITVYKGCTQFLHYRQFINPEYSEELR